jgi:Arc/MetJ-type ribon-helix-helix transcriptional regulator
MRKQLDELVSSLRRKGVPANRSSVARSLLQKGLGNDATVAELQEIMANVHAVTQRALGRAVQDLGPSLKTYLQSELAELHQKTTAG